MVLTVLESQVLNSLISQLYAEAGFSDVDVNDIAADISIDTKIIRGALSSLVKKGIVTLEKTDNWGADKQYVLIYLNESYWHLHPKWSKELI